MTHHDPVGHHFTSKSIIYKSGCTNLLLEQKNHSNQYKLAIILMENRIKPNHLRLLFYFILSLSIHLGLVNQIDVIDFAFHQTKLNISQSKKQANLININ